MEVRLARYYFENMPCKNKYSPV